MQCRKFLVLLLCVLFLTSPFLVFEIPFAYATNSLTYSPSTNTVTCVGYITGTTPYAFNDLWVADKAGTLDLDSRQVSAVDAAPVALTYNLRPTDYYVLGGASNDLYITVTGFSGLTSATIQITGTDSAGNAQSETLVFVGDGTQYAVNYYHTLTDSQVTVFVGVGVFSYTVTQDQWGVVWKQSTTQFTFDCKIAVGNGSTATYFTDTNKQITFPNGVITAASQVFILTKANTTSTFGVLEDVTSKRVSSGCAFISLDTGTYFHGLFQSDSALGFLYIYSAYAYFVSGNSAFLLRGQTTAPNNVRMWGCTLSGTNPTYASAANINRLTAQKFGAGLYNVGTFEDVKLLTTVNYQPAVRGYSNLVYTYTNLYVRGLIYAANHLVEATLGTYYLINADSDNWNMDLRAASVTVFRQYEFDLTVTDKTGTVLTGKNVSITMTNGTSICNLASNSTGQIPTQTLTYGYYNQAHGDTLQSTDYSPYNLTIYDYTGTYLNYTTNFTPLAKTNLQIALINRTEVGLPYVGAAFNFTPANPQVGEEVTFNGTYCKSNTPITDYSWDFGDGNTTVGNYPTITHSYTANATYTPSLTITTNEGSASISEALTVGWGANLTLGLPYIVAAFNLNNSAPLTNEDVYFNGSYSHSDSALTYFWDFGDGVNSTDAEATHNWTMANIYTVSLNVSSASGYSLLTFPLTVSNAPIGNYTIAQFIFNPSNPQPNATVTFDASGSTSSTAITSYDWDFGDNVTDSGVSPTHTYAVEGNYTVTLNVTSTTGFATQTQIVSVAVLEDQSMYVVAGIICAVVVAVVVAVIFMAWKRKQ